jgi:hypothetical protein
MQVLVEERVTEYRDGQSRPSSVGDFEAPRITLLGSLDDDRGGDETGLVETPMMKIIYNGV